MKIKIILALIFTSLFIAQAFAQTSIKAEVDKTSVTTDDLITYKLIITSAEKNIPKPQLPKFTGFQIISSAQSSTVSFIKSEVKTIVVYAFILLPTGTGKFEIEPSTIKIKNETYATPILEIEVQQAKPKPKAEPRQKPPLPKETQPETEAEPQITL